MDSFYIIVACVAIVLLILLLTVETDTLIIVNILGNCLDNVTVFVVVIVSVLNKVCFNNKDTIATFVILNVRLTDLITDVVLETVVVNACSIK